MSCHVMSCHVHVISRLLTSCHIRSCHVMSTSCHVMSCHLTSSHVLPTSLPYHVILLENLAPEPSKFFYYGGGVGFSKPWPCAGSRLGATLSLWRRVHCERLRVAPCAFLGPGHRFCVAGCGDRACWRCVRGRAGGCVAALCRGGWVPGVFLHTHGQRAFRVGRLRESCVLGAWPGACPQAVSAAPCRGDWVRGVSRARMILRAATCVSRGRCGTSDALMRSGRHWTVDPRGRRSESCAVAEIAGFSWPCARNRVRGRALGRCKSVAGAGNPWICGCELGADVSWNAAAGCAGRVACAALCRGTQWQAVTMGVGRVARAARAALCRGGLLLGVSRGCRCAMGMAAGRVAWVALCHGDCCWASRVGVAVPWGLLGGAVLSVAPCLGDC